MNDTSILLDASKLKETIEQLALNFGVVDGNSPNVSGSLNLLGWVEVFLVTESSNVTIGHRKRKTVRLDANLMEHSPPSVLAHLVIIQAPSPEE